MKHEKKSNSKKSIIIAGGSMAYYAKVFESVGWFIPPYAAMGWISSLARKISNSADAFTQDDLEIALNALYSTVNLAAMVMHRYPIAPVINDYSVTISEAVEAHFLGLDHVAVAGLIPVIEGAGRLLSLSRGLTDENVRDVFIGLAEDCKRESVERNIGAVDEIESMMDSFAIFADRYLYARAKSYPFHDKTNRHGILHGEYSDQDYGRPLNFYKAIAAVDFLTFISSFRANISWFAPNPSEQSVNLSRYYMMLGTIRERFGS